MRRKTLNVFLSTMLTASLLMQSTVSVLAVEPADDGALTDETVSEGTEEVPEEITETPETPEETPEAPEETPEVPEETPEVPEETPEVPEETPEVPEETPADETEEQIAVEKVTVAQAELELQEGETALIEAAVAPENATNKGLVYTSDNEEVATVDENGNVTCVAEGTATITVASAEDETICAAVLVTGLSIAGALAETNYNFVPDSFAENTVADWKFDPDYFKEGTLADGNLVIGDASGNGNDLILNTERVPEGQTAEDFMSFSADNIFGNEETESLKMKPYSTMNNSGKKKGAFFETVPGAAVGGEEFKDGYTIEVIMKLSGGVSAWSTIIGQKGTGKLAGMIGDEPEVNGGLNVSGSYELQWNPWTANNGELLNNATTWSDAGGLQSDKWHHVVIKNDGHNTIMIVDGIQVQRCNTFQNQMGIKSLSEKAWVVGTAYWSDADAFSEAECGDAIFKGSIQEIRMSRGLIDPSEYLVTEHQVDDKYYVNGRDDLYPDLEGKKNYTFVNIPDPQYQTQYKSAIVDAQTEWIRDNAKRLNIGMTLCTGDLTQDNTEREYILADKAFSTLDAANLPYLVAPGNHDLEKDDAGNEVSVNAFKKYFSGARYEGDTGYRGSGPSGLSSYSIIKAGSYEYLFLSLPWRAQDKETDKEWILKVLDTHREYPTVILSHYSMDEDFVMPFDQVFMTVRGHVGGRWSETYQNNYGHDVINIVTNYQFDLYGGNGWLSTTEFDEEANKIHVRCYSPWVEKKMRILNGEIENNGILLADEMQLFPFDRLVNGLFSGHTEEPIGLVTFDMNFEERFPNGTEVSMEDLNLKADLLKEKIDAAERALEKANELQYTAEDIEALEAVLEEAKALYAEYEEVSPVTPIEVLEALKDNMIAAKNALIEAVNTFEDAAKPVTEISIIGGDFAMNVNETKELKAVVGPEEAVTKDVVWASSNEKVAVVDENGKVTALKEGIALITATTTDGSDLTAVAFVTIKQPAKGVIINKDKATMRVGNRMQLSAKVTEGTNKDVVWVSSNPEIAMVDQFGMVTALKEGEVQIAAVAADGQGAYAVCAVSVTDGKNDPADKDDDKKPSDDKKPNDDKKNPSDKNKTDKPSPKTGDQNTTGMMTATVLLVVSLGAIVALVVRKKRQN